MQIICFRNTNVKLDSLNIMQHMRNYFISENYVLMGRFDFVIYVIIEITRSLR